MVGAWTKAGWHAILRGSCGAVGAPDDGLDFGTTRACDDCDALGTIVSAEVVVKRSLPGYTYLEANWIKSAAPTVEPN